jgi:hypothetical protein
MVETPLTPQRISDGIALIEGLDRAGISPDAAFWFYFPDIRGWKLILAEAKVGPEGPRGVYRQIQKTMNSISDKLSSLTLTDVAVAKPDAPLIALLRQVVATGPGIVGMRFTNNVVNGTLIEDAYIYRIRNPAA